MIALHRQDQRHLTLARTALAMLAITMMFTSSLLAATKAERREQAEQLVKQALHNEVYGGLSERAELLQAAGKIDADYAPVQWHQGAVKYQKEWVDANQLPTLLKENPTISLYVKERAQVHDTIQGNLQLADWCRKKGLPDQERAHLMRILDFNMNHPAARTRLGFRQVNGQWVTSTDVKQARQRFKTDQKNFATWGPRIDRLRQQFRNGNPAQRKIAQQRLLEINSDDAIVALEQVLARDSEPSALLAVEALHHLSHYEATQALARLVGRPQAIKLLYDGEMISAQEAFDMGLVDALVAPDELRSEVQAYGETLAAKPPEALAAIRQTITLGGAMNFEDGMALERDHVARLAGTDNFREGLTAFIEKRSPVWKG